MSSMPCEEPLLRLQRTSVHLRAILKGYRPAAATAEPDNDQDAHKVHQAHLNGKGLQRPCDVPRHNHLLRVPLFFI